MRDHYASALHSKRPKKRCAGSVARPECAEMILDYGQSDKCLECKESVRRENAKRYAQNRKRNRRKLHQPANDQPGA